LLPALAGIFCFWSQVMKVGILTGGGDCPGLNAVIRATAKSLLRPGGHRPRRRRHGQPRLEAPARARGMTARSHRTRTDRSDQPVRKLLVLALVGLASQLVDGALGMGYGVTSSSLSATRASAATRATSSEEMADMGRVYPGASKPQPHLDTS